MEKFETINEDQSERLDHMLEDMTGEDLEKVIQVAEDWLDFHGEREYYNVGIRVHRDDVRHALKITDGREITDAEMQVIAKKLGDALMYEYWPSLEIIAEAEILCKE